MPPLLQWLPRYALPSALSIVATYAVACCRWSPACSCWSRLGKTGVTRNLATLVTMRYVGSTLFVLLAGAPMVGGIELIANLSNGLLVGLTPTARAP